MLKKILYIFLQYSESYLCMQYDYWNAYIIFYVCSISCDRQWFILDTYFEIFSFTETQFLFKLLNCFFPLSFNKYTFQLTVFVHQGTIRFLVDYVFVTFFLTVREVFSLHMSRGRLLSAVGLIKLLKLARRMRSFGLVWLGVVWLVALRLRNGLRLGCLGLLLLLVQLLDRLDLLLQLHSP